MTGQELLNAAQVITNDAAYGGPQPELLRAGVVYVPACDGFGSAIAHVGGSGEAIVVNSYGRIRRYRNAAKAATFLVEV